MYPTQRAASTALVAFAAGVLAAVPAQAGQAPARSGPGAAGETVSAAPTGTAAVPYRKKIYITGGDVNLRECPRLSCRVAEEVSYKVLLAFCQTDHYTSNVFGNRWWSKVAYTHGSHFHWVTNVYVRGANPRVPGLPNC